MKLIAMSFDDGEIQDRRLASLLREYGLKASFALCCGYLGQEGDLPDGRHWAKTTAEEMSETYAGFELCAHGFYHRDFASLSKRKLREELFGDIYTIARCAGQTVRGAVYPGGRCNDTAARVLKRCGMIYARTAEPSRSLRVPSDLMRFAPTCHMLDSGAFDFADKLERENGDAVLNIFGHSYELDAGDGWEKIERLFARLASVRGAVSVSLGDAVRLLSAKDGASEVSGAV